MTSLDPQSGAFSPTLRQSALKGSILGVLSLFLYLLFVVITTPSLPPLYAVRVAIVLRWWVLLGVSVAVGVQTSLNSYAKTAGCNVRRKSLGGSTGAFAALSSFFSYLALIPVGCCGLWLYVLSLLPGLIGVTASAFLIVYGTELGLLSLGLMAASVTYTYFSLRRRLRDVQAMTPPPN